MGSDAYVKSIVGGQLETVFGGFSRPPERLHDEPSHPSEDFSRLATAVNTPYVVWFLSSADPETLRRAYEQDRLLDDIPIKSGTSLTFQRITSETGIFALPLAALSVLQIEGRCGA